MSFTLMACGSTQIKYVDRVETIEVEKPVFTVPQEIKDLKPLERPKLEYNNLTETDKQDPDKVIKSAIKSIIQLQTHVEKHEVREEKILEAIEEAEERSKEKEGE